MDSSTPRTATSFWSVIFAIFFGNFLASLSTTTINIALPDFMQEFSSQLQTVQWMVTGFMLATGIIAPVLGFLGDQLSYKRVYLISLSGFTICSALCLAAWNIESLIFFRIMQGLFSGLIMPATMTIIYQVIGKEKQAFALSLWSVAAMLGPAIGPTLGGLLVQYFNWHALFLINLPIGVTAILVAVRRIPYYKLSKKQSFDVVGFITVIGSSTSLLVAFSEGSTWGWGSLKTVALLIAGAAMLAFFIGWELKVKEPLLHLRVFRIRRFTYSIVLQAIISISLYSGTFLVPIFLQTVLEVSPMQAGLVMLPGSLMMVICAPISGRLYARIGPVWLCMVGVILMFIATLMLSSLTVSTTRFYIAFWMAFRYVGIAFANLTVTNSGMSAVPREETGHASSINNWIKQGMGSFAIGIFSSILASRTAVHLQAAGKVTEMVKEKAFTWGVDDVFVVATVIVAVAIPMSFLLRRKKPVPAAPAA
ncbi:DHA2 family efflux MFS transporter permease subunit [Paenibacillus sp. XY044]|uniref:DHA2 family efflux MFS transporter permease subunit n=1 Tax=Paenibacillus sp. XY044 TaxID=2026089 RepID=UPI000B98826B|nr:DHA2 family efflux MFS transporter permease subunit [Paenibacillus sp. XY044]OZB98206.1 MFS transporter [Paenibacillus sp. XY044]